MAGSETAFPPARPPPRRPQAALTRVTRASGRLQPSPRAPFAFPGTPGRRLVPERPRRSGHTRFPKQLCGSKVSSLPSPTQSLRMPPSGFRCWGAEGDPRGRRCPAEEPGLSARGWRHWESPPERKRRVKPPAPTPRPFPAGGPRCSRCARLKDAPSPRALPASRFSNVRALLFFFWRTVELVPDVYNFTILG